MPGRLTSVMPAPRRCSRRRREISSQVTSPADVRIGYASMRAPRVPGHSQLPNVPAHRRCRVVGRRRDETQVTNQIFSSCLILGPALPPRAVDPQQAAVRGAWLHGTPADRLVPM